MKKQIKSTFVGFCGCGCGNQFDASVDPWKYPYYQIKHSYLVGHDPKARFRFESGILKYRKRNPRWRNTSARRGGVTTAKLYSPHKNLEQWRKETPNWIEYARQAGLKGYCTAHQRPNNTELEMQQILEKLAPGCWKFYGLGKYGNIEGLLPDFVHEEKKLIIEVAGRKWHSQDYPRIRSQQLKQRGFNTCIVFWDNQVSLRFVKRELSKRGLL